MQTISTNTYKIQANDCFSIAIKDYEFFTLSNNNEKYERQMPMLNMALSESKELSENDHWKANTYTESLLKYFKTKRYAVKLVGDLQTLEIVGKTAYFQKAESTVDKIKIHHYFINIVIDDDFMLEASADVEDALQSTYEPLFWQAIKSVEWLGNYRHFTDIANKAFEEQEAKFEAKLKALENLNKNTLHHTTDDFDEEIKLPQTPIFKIPEDGKDHISVGDFSVSINPESKCVIAERAKTVYIDFKIDFKQPKKAQKAEVLSSYPGDSFSIKFDGKNLYHQGQPKGKYSFKENKTENHKSISFDGLNNSLKFTGNVIFEDNCIAILGHLHTTYDKQIVVPISLYKHYKPESLIWENYQFTLEEALQAPPEVVTDLYVKSDSLTAFPEDIFKFKNLKYLRIQGWKKDGYARDTHFLLPINHIPEAIGNLKQLEELDFYELNISSLPESIANLPQLRYLNVQCSPLEKVPEALFHHQKLKHLTLKGCLKRIPDNINLPALKSIRLMHNQLSTLPESLLTAQLQYIYITSNPFTSLPDAFKTLETDLSLAEKQALFNWDYQGADGTGTIAFEDTIFKAQGDKNLIQTLDIPEGEFFDEIAHLATKALYFKQGDADDFSTLGNHRVGGMPDLPLHIDYPRFGNNWRDDKTDYVYEFLAQINCEQLAHLQEYLPRKGMLFFFLQTLHNLHIGEACVKVMYVENPATLVSGKRFKFTQADYDELYAQTHEGYYEPYKLQVKTHASLPILNSYAAYENTYLYSEALYQKIKAEEDHYYDGNDLFAALNEQSYEQTLITINSYSNWEGPTPQQQAAAKLGGNPKDWLIILKLGSVGDMLWGDAGDLFFVMHKSDLAKQDFSKVFVTMNAH